MEMLDMLKDEKEEAPWKEYDEDAFDEYIEGLDDENPEDVIKMIEEQTKEQ